MNVAEIRNSINIITEESSTADMLEDWITRNNASAESEQILYALIKHLEDTDTNLRAKVIQFINLSMGMDESIKEGHITLPPIDTERYGERRGLEGPIRARNGRVVYYDPKEGMYYDPDTDMYISHDDWEEMNRH